MAEDNFRETFIFRVAAIRKDDKAIDKLLEEKPVDIKNLATYIKSYGLTWPKRLTVWKIMLGIINHNEDDNKYIEKVHGRICDLLENALIKMGFIQQETSPSAKLSLMYILENRDLPLNTEKQPPLFENLDLIANSFIDFGFPFMDTYWLYKRFIAKLEDQRQNMIKMAQKFTIDDKELEKHLNDTGAIDSLPISIWFQRCFSGTLHHSSLIRVLDQIIAGFFQLLPLVAKSIFNTLKDQLMALKSSTDIRKKLLEPIKTEISELIVCQALGGTEVAGKVRNVKSDTS